MYFNIAQYELHAARTRFEKGFRGDIIHPRTLIAAPSIYAKRIIEQLKAYSLTEQIEADNRTEPRRRQ